jgi:FixJ family two-component response regulator
MSHPNASVPDGKAKPPATVSIIGVVDDDESVRDALSSLIRSAGYRCVVFPSAEAFLDSGAVGNTDCTVLDIKMPGLSGLELQLRLREMRCSLPIVFVTGHADDLLRAKAFEGGAVAFLSKPFSEEALLGAIRSALSVNGSESLPQPAL